MLGTKSYRRFSHRAASVRTTVRLGVSRSTGLRTLARISHGPIGVETARRAATLPRVYRTLGLTPVTALLLPPPPPRKCVSLYSLTPSSLSFFLFLFRFLSSSLSLFYRETLYKGSDGHSIFPLAEFLESNTSTNVIVQRSRSLPCKFP